ncbi:hypothetical protein ACKFKG_29050 [Phormidesmis sp. 146-35]
MPRLVGKRSNSDSTIALFLLLAIAAGTFLEFAGYINLIQGFGRDGRYNYQPSRVEEVI